MTSRRVGIDVGGTKCLGVALDSSGAVVDELRLPTPNDADHLIDTLGRIASELGVDGRLGVCVPGLVDRDGVLLAAPNLTQVRHLRLKERLEATCGIDVSVDNDNTVACLAEWKLGAGRGVDDMLLVGLGTGIGGGFVSGGAIQRGHHGFAGEFGHMIVDTDGVPCPCGQRGCWERYASGSGLGYLARRAASDGLLESVLAEVGDIGTIRGEHVTRAAQAGDRQALAVVDTYATWVALGLVNLTNLFDPARIVLSGGLSADPHTFLPPIVTAFGRRLFGDDLRPRPDLVFAELGPRAGAIGAALMTEL